MGNEVSRMTGSDVKSPYVFDAEASKAATSKTKSEGGSHSLVFQKMVDIKHSSVEGMGPISIL